MLLCFNNFVANLIILWASCLSFLVFGSFSADVPLNFEFGASFSLANENPNLAHALLGLDEVPVSPWISAFVGSGRF